MDSPTSRSEDLLNHFFERFFGFEFLLVLEVVGILFFALALLEVAWDFQRGRRKSAWEPLANLSFQMVVEVLNRTFFGLILILVFVWAEQFAVAQISLTWWSWAACLICADFSYYWMHRIEHRVRFFWALHSVHHSSEEYDLSTAFRVFWFIDLTIVFFFLPMILVGFAAPQVLVCMLIVFSYMIWVHTEKIGSMGWFDKMFSSPSVHRVHHGSNPQYLDKNYAGILLVWDRLFGTYEPEVEKVRFGLTTPVNTTNPLRIGFHELICLWQDLKRRRGWKDRLFTLIKPPGWKPGQEYESDSFLSDRA